MGSGKNSMIYTGVIDHTKEIIKCKLCGQTGEYLIRIVRGNESTYEWVCDDCYSMEPRISTLTERNKWDIKLK